MTIGHYDWILRCIHIPTMLIHNLHTSQLLRTAAQKNHAAPAVVDIKTTHLTDGIPVPVSNTQDDALDAQSTLTMITDTILNHIDDIENLSSFCEWSTFLKTWIVEIQWLAWLLTVQMGIIAKRTLHCRFRLGVQCQAEFDCQE